MCHGQLASALSRAHHAQIAVQILLVRSLASCAKTREVLLADSPSNAEGTRCAPARSLRPSLTLSLPPPAIRYSTHPPALFLQERSLLCSGSLDGFIRLWDVRGLTQQHGGPASCLLAYRAHDRGVVAADISRWCGLLFTAGLDHTVKVKSRAPCTPIPQSSCLSGSSAPLVAGAVVTATSHPCRKATLAKDGGRGARGSRWLLCPQLCVSVA
jgi:WD40 repeat protein